VVSVGRVWGCDRGPGVAGLWSNCRNEVPDSDASEFTWWKSRLWCASLVGVNGSTGSSLPSLLTASEVVVDWESATKGGSSMSSMERTGPWCVGTRVNPFGFAGVSFFTAVASSSGLITGIGGSGAWRNVMGQLTPVSNLVVDIVVMLCDQEDKDEAEPGWW
jgi:hypothetical protein